MLFLSNLKNPKISKKDDEEKAAAAKAADTAKAAAAKAAGVSVLDEKAAAIDAFNTQARASCQ